MPWRCAALNAFSILSCGIPHRFNLADMALHISRSTRFDPTFMVSPHEYA
ncbi:putative lipoprotein [Brucella ovis ATCC 25840]|uniref:Lipoprotein n=1 Tax=Brucella ovis (strain ATCC 25840 / 63/290 / NCTC 10512) TaxID=444178 RepID=A0A0H3AT98_BRUO2|nr:putative lipoprotein [Brucella ovis ATCC 25840]